jgi:hypothetical protein
MPPTIAVFFSNLLLIYRYSSWQGLATGAWGQERYQLKQPLTSRVWRVHDSDSEIILPIGMRHTLLTAAADHA